MRSEFIAYSIIKIEPCRMEVGQVVLSAHPAADAFDIAAFKVRSWQGITAQLVRIEGPTIFNFRVAATSHFIALHDIYRIDGETIASNVEISHAHDLRNKITYLPEGCRLNGWCKIDKPATILSVTIDPAIFNDRVLKQLPPRVEFEDQALHSVLLQFRKILDDNSCNFPSYPESLAKLLVAELGQQNHGSRRHSCDYSGLSPSQLELVIQYIDQNLNKAVSVSELAKLLGYSTSHFVRAFRRTAGLTPYQFLIRRRVDFSKEILQSRHVGIKELSVKLGFCGSTQFARAFRRHVGIAPSKFRRGFR